MAPTFGGGRQRHCPASPIGIRQADRAHQQGHSAKNTQTVAPPSGVAARETGPASVAVGIRCTARRMAPEVMYAGGSPG